MCGGPKPAFLDRFLVTRLEVSGSFPFAGIFSLSPGRITNNEVTWQHTSPRVPGAYYLYSRQDGRWAIVAGQEEDDTRIVVATTVDEDGAHGVRRPHEMKWSYTHDARRPLQVLAAHSQESVMPSPAAAAAEGEKSGRARAAQEQVGREDQEEEKKMREKEKQRKNIEEQKRKAGKQLKKEKEKQRKKMEEQKRMEEEMMEEEEKRKKREGRETENGGAEEEGGREDEGGG